MNSKEMKSPMISVVIRSYNRLNHVLEIVQVCCTQTYENFEVVILDQSSDNHFKEYSPELNKLDSRFRVVHREPLGGTGARNYGVAYSKGEIILFMDDDDIPIGNNWIADHARNYNDPNCIGVSGRHIYDINEIVRYPDIEKAYRRCLTVSALIRGRVFTGINKVKVGVDWLHGNNSSMRRETIINLGGWYPHVKSDHEEHSLYFKFHKKKKSGQYLKFDPAPVVLRRFDIAGGAERRTISMRLLLDHRLRFCHWVIGEEYPIRFYIFYPFFMIYSFQIAALHMINGSSFIDSIWIKKLGLKWGKRIYVAQELLLFPLMIIKYLIIKRPTWDGDIKALIKKD
tara:strand:+ start:4833 stop:5858 length:1026 start_codon:yes stop_codon:yes gene_type:complete